jgi:DNA-binding response OmpR family regulator
LPRVLILANESEEVRQLVTELARYDFACSVSDAAGIDEKLMTQRPELVLLEVDSLVSVGSLCQALRQMVLPTIALARLETVNSLNGHLEADDFIVKPYNPRELVARAKKLLHRNAGSNAEVIRYEDLSIDTARCEVTIAGHRKILTFKEYELLKFLASNPGRVFTRDTLLDRVWGHDYFGGDRTVDVHVRRLRSKIEDSGHCFIETVRNIGYRFQRTPKL